jgi:hypothetical protein
MNYTYKSSNGREVTIDPDVFDDRMQVYGDLLLDDKEENEREVGLKHLEERKLCTKLFQLSQNGRDVDKALHWNEYYWKEW